LGANLSRANLYGANLYGANLYGAKLSGADLYGATFENCNGLTKEQRQEFVARGAICIDVETQ
jgi:uncharacterized protein YjbI with pentapeptide repeats